MSDKVTVAIKPVTKNEVTVTPVIAKIKRGSAKDIEYPYFQVTEANLMDWIKFRGPKIVAKMANAREQQEGQSALDVAGEWEEKKSVDENNKEVIIHLLSNIDSDKYWNAYISDTLRGGETKAKLMEEQEELKVEFMDMFTEMMKPANQNPAKQDEFKLKMLELQKEVQDLDVAIAERSRERKAKKAA